MPEERIRVVLIEDNPGDARLVMEALADSRVTQFDVKRFDRLADGLKALSENATGVVLVDLSLPDCPPSETVARVTAAAVDLPVIVLTGLDDPGFSRELVKHGAQDYLVKGQFDGRLLERSISYALERKRIAGELSRARDEALEASALKSSFLANMSHEIRTPMNAIIGMTRILLDTELGNEQREFAEEVWTSAHSLLGIINDILDFTKVASGKLLLDEIDFCPAEVIEGAIALFAERVQGSAVELVSYIDAEVPVRLRGDPLRLRQVLVNLIGNAIKFTERGYVAVTLGVASIAEGSVQLRLNVRDSGIGISPEAQEHLFQPFYQADRSSTRRHAGTGLGLAICAQIVGLLGGSIEVDSYPGRGSSFWCTLRMYRTPGFSTVEGQEHQQLAGTRVLLLDQVEVRSRYLRQQLSAWGVETVAAESTAAAKALLRDETAAGRRFDGCVLDVGTDPDARLEFAAEVGNEQALGSARLIAGFPLGRKPDESRLRAAGIRSWFSWPVRYSQLYKSLVTAIAGDPRDGGEVPVERPRPSRASFDQLRAAGGKTSARILVVEDHPINRRMALRMLERLGHRADWAINGIQAVEALRKSHYELVLMDCQMPEMDGYEATRTIRQESKDGARVAIVGVTAHAFECDRQKCLDAGMDDYLSKPLLPEDLAAALARWLPSGSAAAGGSSETAPPALDPDALEGLKRSISYESGVLVELIGIFIKDLDDRLKTMSIALADRNADGLAHTAHALKGASGHFGARLLVALCLELERKSRRGELDGADVLVARIAAEATRVREALQHHSAESAMSDPNP